MDVVPVPDSAREIYPHHQVVAMGPPPGVDDAHCGTAQMLLGRAPTMPGFEGRDQLAFFKPTPSELEVLNHGGLLVMNQVGHVVQPFSLSVFVVDNPDDTEAAED